MSMDLDDLEARFHTLADDLSAPPTDDARVAIGRRSRVLRRRRQTRRAVGSVVVVALVAGIAVLQNLRGDESGSGLAGDPDVSTGEPSSDLPAWTLDLPGWEVTHAYELSDGDDTVNFPTNQTQVFRQSDDLLGPTVVVGHVSGSDAGQSPVGSEAVNIGSDLGSIHDVGPDRFAVRWNPGFDDSSAVVESFGLSRDEVLEFASGLVPYDHDVTYPAAPDDRFGFEATAFPAGVEEVAALDVGREPRYDVRAVEASEDAETVAADQRLRGDTVSIFVDNADESVFTDELARLLIYAEEVEQVDIAGHQAFVFAGNSCDCTLEPSDDAVDVIWRQGGATIRVTITVGVPSTGGRLHIVGDEVIGGLRQISEDEWRALDAAAPDPDREVGPK